MKSCFPELCTMSDHASAGERNMAYAPGEHDHT